LRVGRVPDVVGLIRHTPCLLEHDLAVVCDEDCP
jgi:hypothetical protein